MEDITIKYKKLVETVVMPTKSNKVDAGFNIRAIDRTVIRPYSIGKIRTGLALEVPEGYELQIRGKYSISVDKGLAIAQGIGTIDSGCREEVIVLLRNIQPFSKIIEPGEIVGQFIINKIPNVSWEEVSDVTIKPTRNPPKENIIIGIDKGIPGADKTVAMETKKSTKEKTK